MAYSRAQFAKWEAQETEETKTCSLCGKVKSLHRFSICKTGRKFCYSYCKKMCN